MSTSDVDHPRKVRGFNGLHLWDYVIGRRQHPQQSHPHTERWVARFLLKCERELELLPEAVHNEAVKCLVDVSLQLEDIMTMVQIDQTVIDNWGQQIEQAAQVLATQISTLLQEVANAGVTLPDAVVSGVQTALSDLTGIETPVPVTPTPTPDPTPSPTPTPDPEPTPTPDPTPAASAPTVTAVTPSTGSVGGGETIDIAGTGFTGATDVEFGTEPAASFTVNSDTDITATAPDVTADGAATVDVTVTTPAGSSATSTADSYTTS